MPETNIYYCKGTESMKLCTACENFYYGNRERVDAALTDKNLNLFKIDDTECKINNAKFFISKIKKN